jgi:tetratricopeptide (TPR) repeat protein
MRHRQLLMEQLGRGGGSASGGEAPGADDEDVGEIERAEPLPPVAADDARLDPAIGLPIDLQRQLLAVHDRLEEIDPFRLLGIAPTHDLKQIRRAYHEVSRDWHPDAHYSHGGTTGLGGFRQVLADLFARAKAAHQALQDPAIRTPHVDAAIAERARRREIARMAAEQKDAARRAEIEARRRAEEEEAAARRRQREDERARKERERVTATIRAGVEQHVRAAEEAERAGNMPQAANYYRMALQIDPKNKELQQAWDRCRTVARRARATVAFQRATQYTEMGQHAEAVALFVEAAEADPTLEHLAHAADAVRARDPARARTFALQALEVLGSLAEAERPRAAHLGHLHVLLARAFLAAGQANTARDQARIAERLRPGDPEIRALLNTIKAM